MKHITIALSVVLSASLLFVPVSVVHASELLPPLSEEVKEEPLTVTAQIKDMETREVVVEWVSTEKNVADYRINGHLNGGKEVKVSAKETSWTGIVTPDKTAGTVTINVTALHKDYSKTVATVSLNFYDLSEALTKELKAEQPLPTPTTLPENELSSGVVSVAIPEESPEYYQGVMLAKEGDTGTVVKHIPYSKDKTWTEDVTSLPAGDYVVYFEGSTSQDPTYVSGFSVAESMIQEESTPAATANTFISTVAAGVLLVLAMFSVTLFLKRK